MCGCLEERNIIMPHSFPRKAHKPMDFIICATKREDMKAVVIDSSGSCVSALSTVLI